ncbi:SsrA-binding protein SmpB [Buchnera aphidicola]|uniref:SsrA-binding protein SmpB n=1 Tax=Buchnera aphidicola TaxID=9 RepID=UPI0020927ADC|nr:SsrA-binding protein SmpB [Buchnera aphidicola]USS94297.1 SsrA-binding protein SmpB [Buchnera aphidicola (Sipha maydis)]
MIKKNKKKIISFNKKVKFNFFIKKKFVAGIVLQGWEVKSLRQGKINISRSYILLRDNEIYLVNCEIQPLKSAFLFHSSQFFNRNRKLLLLKKEIHFLANEINKNNKYTIVPISVFWKNSFCKLNIGLALGKKLYDKRHEKKNKFLKRELSRICKNFKI